MNRTIATLALTLLPTLAFAQATPDKLSPPSPGLLISYTYWPIQYIQWVGAELPYAMIELDVDPTPKQPLLYLTLTTRADGKRIHYTNSDTLVAFAQAQGEEVHKSAMAFDDPGAQSSGAISALRLTLSDGKPLQWRFVQGSDISEQGSGLTPLPQAKMPILAFREQGAVAGEGTALQIGDIVSPAAVWTEISHPPQFIAYHAALTSSAHTVVFLPGQRDWTIASSPATLTPGLTWELDSPTGDHRSLKIDKVDGSRVTFTAADRFTPAIRLTLEAVHNPDNTWALQSLRYAPVHDGLKHFALLQLASPLPSNGPDDLTLFIGKKKIATGTVSTSGTPQAQSLTLDLSNPTWLHGKTLTELSTTSASSISLSAHP